jgi:septum site-determining protein MinC
MSEPTADPSSQAPAEPAGMPRTPARPAAELKGLSHPALRLVLNEPDDAAIAAALDELLEESDDAFEWQPVVIDAARVASAEKLDLSTICDRLRDVRQHPVAVAGAHAALRVVAARERMGWLAALPERRARAEAAHDDATRTGAGGSEATAAGTSQAGEAARASGRADAAAAQGSGRSDAAAAQPAEAAAPAVPAGAMVIERPVRSGQQVYARDRDLVVIGDVSPGAEVIADGHVHVYGTLAGRAIAGARGRRDAGIFTLELRAELVAVCGIYRTFEEGPPAANAGRPVRISLEASADTLSIRTL